MCNWKLLGSGETIAHSESPDDVIGSAAAALNGRRVEALVLQQVIAPDRVYHAATFHFSDRASLRLEQYDNNEPDEALFSVRIGEGHWVSYDSAGRIREHKKA